MKDWRGTPIKVGLTVVYPSRKGSRLWMTEAVVISLDPLTVKKKGAQRSSHPAAERVTVIRTGRIIHGDAD